MFSGIVQTTGVIRQLKKLTKGIELVVIAIDIDYSTVKIGDSIAIDGVCLTVVELINDGFRFDASQETLDCTIFSDFKVGRLVNVEQALRINQGIDGHLVSAHVDGVSELINSYNEGSSVRLQFSVDVNLIKYIAKKGSVCINGVSLTVNKVEGDCFFINIVPHTLKSTTLINLVVGDLVNLEVDIIARYLEQLLTKTKSNDINHNFLSKNGYL